MHRKGRPLRSKKPTLYEVLVVGEEMSGTLIALLKQASGPDALEARGGKKRPHATSIKECGGERKNPWAAHPSKKPPRMHALGNERGKIGIGPDFSRRHWAGEPEMPPRVRTTVDWGR